MLDFDQQPGNDTYVSYRRHCQLPQAFDDMRMPAGLPFSRIKWMAALSIARRRTAPGFGRGAIFSG
jgi:hypothetical protein